MKSTITIIYTTILSILFITVLFTIAELNIIVKTEFTDQLQQSVIMSASYLILCKLVIQMAITYIIGTILYHRIKDNHDSNDKPTYNKNLWAKYPERMQHHKDREDQIKSWLKQERPVTLDEAFKVDKSFDKVSELKFDPIDQIDVIDKSSIGTKPVTKTSKGKIKDVLSKVEVDDRLIEPKGRLLSDILGNKLDSHTFSTKQIEENRRWEKVVVKAINRINFTSYELVNIGEDTIYYVEVK